MADSYTPNLNLRQPEVGHANDTWGSIPGLNGDLATLDSVYNPDGLSPAAPTTGPFAGVPGVGLRIGVGKTLNIEGFAYVFADHLTLYDLVDATKQARFSLAAQATGTLSTFTLPPGSDTLVTLGATQTLASKTLSSPTFTGTPVAPTAAPGTGGTQVATQAYADAAAAAVAAAVDQPQPGDVRLTYRQTAATGWLFLDDTTIGSALSPATHAGAQYQNLFTVLWAIPACTIAGGKGASAAADWTANKSITLAKVLGRALGVAGAGSGLTTRNAGDLVGEETHLLTAPEMPSHTHTITPHNWGFNEGGGNVGGGSAMWDSGAPVTLGSTGGGGAHNNMQPTSWLNAEIKL